MINKLEIYGIALVIAAILMAGAYYKGHHAGFTEEKAVYDQFVAKVEAQGEQAKAEAKKKTDEDKLNKDNADESNRKTVASLVSTINSLRAQRPAGGNVPPVPAGSKRPDLICFDREAYKSAYGGLVKDVRGLADEGTAATINLDTAKSWAQRRTNEAK